MTEIKHKGKKIYISPVKDLNTHVIEANVVSNNASISIAISMLEQIKDKSIPEGTIFHSDQGWAYQMKAYSRRLKEERIFQSMSRKGNCHDNSVMENFFGLLKQEIYYGMVYYSYEELKSEIERYIKYYNEQRIKEKLGWMSPVQYRLSLLAA